MSGAAIVTGFAGQVINMRPKIPGAIKEEYEDLYERLNAAARVRGEIGRTAMAAFRHLQSHYLKDQEYALPPLKLLPTVAAGNVTGEIDQIQTMCSRLKRQLPSLIEENDTISGSSDSLPTPPRQRENRNTVTWPGISSVSWSGKSTYCTRRQS